MKHAVILHGTDSSPDSNWFQWLKKQLEQSGYKVWIPELPGNHTPNRKIYNDFMLSSNWDFTDNLVIGHSSGAVSVLNLLEDDRCPRINVGVIVSAWADTDKTVLDKDQFKNLFPEKGFNFSLIKSKVDKLIFVHGDDDPYCPLEQAQWLAEKTNSEIKIIPKGEHLGATRPPEFPELLDLLKSRIEL